MQKNDDKTSDKTDMIDLALQNSTQELQRLASVYQHLGFRNEAQDILNTVTRIQEHMDSATSNTSNQKKAQ